MDSPVRRSLRSPMSSTARAQSSRRYRSGFGSSALVELASHSNVHSCTGARQQRPGDARRSPCGSALTAYFSFPDLRVVKRSARRYAESLRSHP
jgi:hypothetical protein